MGQVLDLPSEITLGFNAYNDMLASIDLSTVAFRFALWAVFCLRDIQMNLADRRVDWLSVEN